MIEGDSANAIKWTKGLKLPPWRLIVTVREIRTLASRLDVSFAQVSRTSNGVTNFFAKRGVDNLVQERFFFELGGDREGVKTHLTMTIFALWMSYFVSLCFVFIFPRSIHSRPFSHLI